MSRLVGNIDICDTLRVDTVKPLSQNAVTLSGSIIVSNSLNVQNLVSDFVCINDSLQVDVIREKTPGLAASPLVMRSKSLQIFRCHVLTALSLKYF